MKKIHFLSTLIIALLATSCGEYFAYEIPDEYDPANKPFVNTTGLASRYEMFVGDVQTFDIRSFTFSNSLSFDRQSADDQAFLISSLFWGTQYADSIVAVTMDDGVYTITAQSIGTDTVSVLSTYDSHLLARCAISVLDRQSAPTAVTLDRHVIYVLEGSSFTFTPDVQPAYTDNNRILWSVSNTDVATVDADGTVHAISAGAAIIYASAEANPSAEDQCVIAVLPDWRATRPTSWRYETIVYATLTVDDRDVTADPNIIVTSRIDSEYRSAGVRSRSHGIDYIVFRVGNDDISDTHVIRFEAYDCLHHNLVDIYKSLFFDAGAVYGTLSSPIVLEGTSRRIQ